MGMYRFGAKPVILPITPPKARVYHRIMTAGDMAEVLAIEGASYDHPWNRDDFLDRLRDRHTVGFVAEEQLGRLSGFMLIEYLPRAIRLLGFAVAIDLRRRGVGSAMVTSLNGKLTPDRRTRIVMHIREHNDAGIAFFARRGFEAIGVVLDHYKNPDGTREDAIAMKFFGPGDQVADDRKGECKGC